MGGVGQHWQRDKEKDSMRESIKQTTLDSNTGLMKLFMAATVMASTLTEKIEFYRINDAIILNQHAHSRLMYRKMNEPLVELVYEFVRRIALTVRAVISTPLRDQHSLSSYGR
ncbi:unnamed protein product [Leuciscus chuanchicus]